MSSRPCNTRAGTYGREAAILTRRCEVLRAQTDLVKHVRADKRPLHGRTIVW